MLEFLQKGGPLMWVILLCSVIALGVFFERLLYLHKASIRVDELLGGISLLIRRNHIHEALAESSVSLAPVARILQVAIAHHKSGREELHSITQDAAIMEIPSLERNLPILATLTYIAPMLGLLGTILGLLDTFLIISSHGGYATLADLSHGIYEGILNSVAGLAVAIPSLIAHSYLTTRVHDIIHDMERAKIEIINLLVAAQDLPASS